MPMVRLPFFSRPIPSHRSATDTTYNLPVSAGWTWHLEVARGKDWQRREGKDTPIPFPFPFPLSLSLLRRPPPLAVTHRRLLPLHKWIRKKGKEERAAGIVLF